MKRRGPPSIITVAILTTITIVFWIFFSVYQILTGDVDIDVPQELLKPINPTLDQELLNSIGNGQEFQENEVVHLRKSGGGSDTQDTNEEVEIIITPTISPQENETISASPSSNLLEQSQ